MSGKNLIIFLMLFLTSCNNKVKEKIGITTFGPNEYEVGREKALEIPPHYYLPEIKNGVDKTASIPKNKQGNLTNSEKALLEDLK